MKKTHTFVNNQGLWSDKTDGCCVGFIVFHEGKAYSPDGIIPGMTAEQATEHNHLLSKALIAGLDTCQIGERGSFYFNGGVIKTWIGEIVSRQYHLNGRVITFEYKGKTFRGRMLKDSDAFNFKRIA